MKARMVIKLTVLGILIVAVGHWLRGHDILTALALLLLLLAVLAKVVFAIISRRKSEPPPGGGGRRYPPDAPVPRPPGGRPPALSAAAEASHESALHAQTLLGSGGRLSSSFGLTTSNAEPILNHEELPASEHNDVCHCRLGLCL